MIKKHRVWLAFAGMMFGLMACKTNLEEDRSLMPKPEIPLDAGGGYLLSKISVKGEDGLYGTLYEFYYDSKNRLERVSTADFAEAASSVRYEYDALDRLSGKYVVAEGQSATVTYTYGLNTIEARQKSSYQEGEVHTIYKQDGQGRIIESYDQSEWRKNSWKVHRYEGNNLMETEGVDYNGEPTGYITAYTYSQFKHPQSMTAALNPFLFNFFAISDEFATTFDRLVETSTYKYGTREELKYTQKNVIPNAAGLPTQITMRNWEDGVPEDSVVLHLDYIPAK